LTTTATIACNLGGTALSDRGDWIRELGRSLIAIHADRGQARLRFEAEKRGELEEFVRAESGCCSFFEFGLATENGTTELSISAPEDAGWAVRGLAADFVAGWGSLV
jgi:hypothetical protein